MFIGLVPVIIGGLLTAIGGFAGVYITHLLSSIDAKKKLKREKLESLVHSAFQTMYWLDENRKKTLFSEVKDIGPPPIFEVELIIKLYIPELKTESIKLSLAEADYRVLLAKWRQKQLSGESLQGFVEEYQSIYLSLNNAVSELINKAEVVAGEI